MRHLHAATLHQAQRCAQVAVARSSIPSDKELAKELGLDPRTVRWLVERAQGAAEGWRVKLSVVITERLPPHLIAPCGTTRRSHSTLSPSGAAALLRQLADRLESDPLLRANGCLEVVLQQAPSGSDGL